ncbi:13954_t:CDS:1, partial [Gigaspora rosea]
DSITKLTMRRYTQKCAKKIVLFKEKMSIRGVHYQMDTHPE